ncbi:zinc ribbon domain-containing protein [Corynebacterium sp.]|uniref:zinc ribbon domain-containing protein n=1 Tax=Corynebacterium sp. TaxID=1720 RepID=UPI0026DC1DA9|nr:C4-type zinc ribbon domain-containing protein [Corynebacterium sp.]MDO5031317.1 C4-type zinc ribbon domain-containing protein [Corynebacterium sp.]
MKLTQQLQPVLLELANLQRAQDAGGPQVVPEQEEYEAAQAKHARLVDAASAAQLAVDDMELEILRIQADERKLRKRERDDKAQLGAATDIEQRRDLEHDLYAAKSRIADLMSELQEAHNEIHALRSNRDVHGARVSESERQLEVLARAAQAAVESAENQESPEVRIGQLREQLPADVLAEYDRMRTENGVGAAKFNGRACGGCFMVLPPAEQNAVRNAPADELPQCGDCGSYLVRQAS